MKHKRGRKKEKKRKRAPGGGRKPGSGIISGIRPKRMTWAHIRNRIIWGHAEWPIIALRYSIDGPKLPNNEASRALLDILRAQFERAALDGDADWFKRQAKAIRWQDKRGKTQKERAQFNWKVVHLFEMANAKHGMPVPAGTFTDVMARDIYKALEKHELPNGHLLVETCRFENKERAMEAIHDLARKLRFELRKKRCSG